MRGFLPEWLPTLSYIWFYINSLRSFRRLLLEELHVEITVRARVGLGQEKGHKLWIFRGRKKSKIWQLLQLKEKLIIQGSVESLLWLIQYLR